ncbi:MAG: hypothetical protein FGM39_03970 [Phycisphaerales bacterium]|nr:hypothetical protein [Phycisphaerales bacterium]
MRRTSCLAAILLLCLTPPGAALAMQRADDDSPRERAAAAGDEDGPSLPTALPDGARLPEPAVVKSMRADGVAGRITVLDRSLSCPKCAGKGTKVTRKRTERGNMLEPVITETVDACPACGGFGFTDEPRRVGPVLDGVVTAIASLPHDLPTAPVLVERARAVLVRVGSTGPLTQAISAVDRNELVGERMSKPGTAVSVTGFVGKPILIGGGRRAYPVLVDGRALILLRTPTIHCAPERGPALVGGILSGPIEGAEWDFGRTMVLDGGFLVPITPPVNRAPAPAAGDDAGAAGGKNASGAGSARSGSGRSGGK